MFSGVNRVNTIYIEFWMNKEKLRPWIWFFILWAGSLSFTLFIAYSLKWFLKLMS